MYTMIWLILFGAPAIFFVWLLIRLNGEKPKGLGWAILFAAYTAFSIHWDVTHSKSSTAGLAYLELPWFCTLMGTLGLGFGKLRYSDNKIFLALGYLCLMLALCFIGLDIRDKF